MKRLPFNRVEAVLHHIDHGERPRDIISGIAPAHVPIFIVAHLAGALTGISVVRSFFAASDVRERMAAPEWT
jgi:hypothetical protein